MRLFRIYHCLFFFLLTAAALAQENQIDFDRVELMPNEPSPYLMRDWMEVAQKYDSFVYDIDKSGQYLPLVFIRDEGVNYPDRPNFGLSTYVGDDRTQFGEGINVLPSIVGATLAGIDKSDQYGRNWVLMSQDYFNLANGEDIYLNNIGGSSGGDWWYDMMPNIFFYQIYDLYGNIGDAEHQFGSVADQMDAAVRALGGSATPWTRAFMDYRAFDFVSMTPNPDGVHEPEAAGAFAWLLYNAYTRTGKPDYLQTAEWSMEFLVNLASNPSYELQLPYGAYMAARMNAEIGTEYKVEKLLFWVFNRGPLRGWGTIVGEWGGLDVSGLVGEANDMGDDYAFQLNAVQQGAALVPLCRYDKRFSRAVGKWFLNMANATRLMFPGFLPADRQDASDWSMQYDPDAVIGYEALREVWMGLSPFSTGDPVINGWAETNLSLYSTSSIGYMGAIMEETNVPKILRLDLLKTDFFHAPAYPSYLYYNPWPELKTVHIDVGNEIRDIYEANSESFIARNVSGTVELDVAADEAISIVLCPADGVLTYENNKMLIDGVVVDYAQTAEPYNYPPRVQAFAIKEYTIESGDSLRLYASAIDQETKDLFYTIQMPDDTVSGEESEWLWIAPEALGIYHFGLLVEDEAGQADTASLTVEVVDEVNIPPQITSLEADPPYVLPGETVSLTATATDENDDDLTFSWNSQAGVISGAGTQVSWTAPSQEGIYSIELQIADGRGGTAQAGVEVFVYDFEQLPSADLIAWYPFDGDADDYSGNALHGQVFGAKLTEDSDGNAQSAYLFDGVNDHIQVPNESVLNFDEGISISFFARPDLIGDKERFFVSHGSWQNRWKISITPDYKLRWTVKNQSGQVTDLDSRTDLEEGEYYHVAATYDGNYVLLYLNGRLESFRPFDGNMAGSPVELEIGQMLPDNQGFNYRGVLDDIRIYDQAIHPDSIALLSGMDPTTTFDPPLNGLGLTAYPNPADEQLNVKLSGYEEGSTGRYLISVFDTQGKLVLSSVASGCCARMNTAHLPSGTYLLHLTTRDAELIRKIRIQ